MPGKHAATTKRRKKKTPNAHAPRVALMIESSTGYGRGLLRGIVRYSRLHGPWSIFVAPGHLEQTLAQVHSWDVDGIICRVSTPKMVRNTLPKGLPFIACFLDEFPSGSRYRCCEIRADSGAISRMVAQHLVERGFRQFGFCGFSGCPWSSIRETQFASYLETRGYTCERHQIHLSPWMRQPNWIRSFKHERPSLLKWLISIPKPVGLMACNDTCGQGVLEACASARLHVPDEVAVVGVDNDELMCEVSNPPLSSVSLELDNAGYESARLLDGLMSGKVEGRHVIEVVPAFVATRASTDTHIQDDLIVMKTLRFIRDHASSPISVTDIVDGVGASRRTLERHFLRSVGYSLLAGITYFHLNRARRLLLETNLPCYRVSEDAGFSSIKVFNRAFRLAEGMTPKEFRATNIKKHSELVLNKRASALSARLS